MKNILIVAVLILTANALAAMSWPTETAVLSRNFGANDRGNPVLGMVFSGETEVLAAETGEVIFHALKNSEASRLPSPLGSWIAIDHEDGLISVYSRLSEPDEPFTKTRVQKHQRIAVSGVTGWTSREGFYFKLFDRRERRWINPAMIITPIHETRAPQIHSVSLKNAQGMTMETRNLSQGIYTVVVNASGGTRLSGGLPNLPYAPQRIVCLINGAEVGALNFEAVSARDGTLMVFRNGLFSAKQVYSNFPAFEAAEVFLTRGQVVLEVIVQDITGNSRRVVQRLVIN